MKTKAIFFICFLLSIPIYTTAGEIVVAKGISFCEPGREVFAREKALDDAKRAAIESAMGVHIESMTDVEDFEVVKDRIFSRSTGYLKSLAILNETRSDLGVYEVEIEAEVEIAALTNDIDRFQRILEWQKNPRISILINKDVDAQYLSAVHKARSIMIDKLKKDGFSVFQYTPEGGTQIGLLVELNLELSTRRSKFQGIDITLNETSLSSNIYRPGDGQILAATSSVHSQPGENRLQILDQGIRTCVDKIWKDLRSELIRLWEKELYSERDISLIINSLPDYSRANEVAGIFSHDVSGVIEAKLIHFAAGKGEYQIKYKGWPDYLLSEIEMSYFKKKYFRSNLDDISGNKLVITIQN